ncbi:MAG: DUF5110 domain-containing protein, partial [Phycisphaerae bacterium]|nr:DUF5110 domain-containing protein [Phycisphaerae bacterium]MDW8261221.1 glycoside hydrolase family 31 protein [Phycisphaerales bacterium]
IVSSRGYGILFDTASLAIFEDTPTGARFWTEVVDELDFYFIFGPEFDQVIASLRKLTGRPPMFPRWACGYVQSKERYRTQQELIEVVSEFRRRRIPIDCIVQDWCTWTGREWGNKTPDPERFPDPAQLVHDLHRMDCRLMVSIWPIMRGECRDQQEMRQAGYLLGNDATYDAFNPAARRLYWEQAYRGWFRHGIDAWWCDCTEPFEADWKGAVKPQPEERMRINTSEARTFLDPQYINAYSLVHSRGIYEHQRATTSQKRVVNLTRSGFPGQQRFGAITWSGDISAKWSTLRKQIADGLNFCVTGNPRWTLDIGGFFVKRDTSFWFRDGDFDGCDDPGYRELYARWFQFGAFLPMFRSHGTDCPREPWRFGEPGEEAYDALINALHLRYRLLPYLYSIAARETLADYTMFRMLAFDFRSDPMACTVADQFMFGPAFLVCPVTEPGAVSRRVYLPDGCDWFDFWTGEKLAGGRMIDAPAPLRQVPLFVRGGSLVPLGPVVQHATEALDAPIELRIYPGSDATFDLYEDENDNYNYELGQYGITPVHWDDSRRRLTIGPRRGTFPGMLRQRTFHAVCVRPGRGVALQPAEPFDHCLYWRDDSAAEASWT